jgi:hypothetical protein
MTACYNERIFDLIGYSISKRSKTFELKFTILYFEKNVLGYVCCMMLCSDCEQWVSKMFLLLLSNALNTPDIYHWGSFLYL